MSDPYRRSVISQRKPKTKKLSVHFALDSRTGLAKTLTNVVLFYRRDGVHPYMISRFVHFILCMSALSCPVLDGACCTGRHSAPEVTTVHVHTDGCCRESAGDAPGLPPSSDECHDCFCAGALPPNLQEGPVDPADAGPAVVPVFHLCPGDAGISAGAESRLLAVVLPSGASTVLRCSGRLLL